MSLRETGKMRRRARILDAARTCLLGGGADQLSTKAIAREAQVSVATLYNLFGSKEGILIALLVTSIESLRERITALAHSTDSDPGGADGPVGALTAIPVEEFTGDAYFYRELIKSLERIEARSHLEGVIKLSVDIGEPIIRRMVEAGALADVVSPRVLAHQIFMSFVHALRMWADGMTSSERFETQVLHSQSLLLAAVANEPLRSRLHHRLTELDDEMCELARQAPAPEETTRRVGGVSS